MGSERADTCTVKTRRLKPVLVAAAVAVSYVSATGCSALDSFTGSQSMRWVGDDVLSKEPVAVSNYEASALLPDLTAVDAMRIFGKSNPTESSDEQAVGNGWSVTVTQSPYATGVRFAQACGALTDDPEVAIEEGQRVLDSLGADSSEWTWFTVADAQGVPRAVAEPNIEGRQTWASGALAVIVDDNGDVCSANGTLLGFEQVDGTTALESAYTVFQDARHTDGLAIAGEYSDFEQTWTLESEGRLVPLWRFKADELGIVLVDFGDGLESALDTRSSLTQTVKQEAAQ